MASILVFATQMSTTGGIENHLVRLCEGLVATEADITFLCPDYRLGSGLDLRLRKSCRRLIALCSIRHRPNAATKLLWLFLALFRLQKRSFDCIYLNGQGSLPFWVWSGLRLRSRRCVVHHHSSGEPDDVATWPPSYLRLLRGASSVVGCSQSNAASIAAIVQRHVRVIYCFSQNCFRQPGRVQPTKLAFGFIGRLIPEKGVDTILRLSSEPHLADIHWHLWGSLDGYPVTFTDSHPNVTLHPPFDSRHGLELAMAQLDAFTLFTTHREGLPLTLLEAMSCGVPWIAADRGGIRDLVIDSTSTILLPQSFTYSDAFDATQALANDLRQGSVSSQELISAYNYRFHPDVITEQWRHLLFGELVNPSDVAIVV